MVHHLEQVNPRRTDSPGETFEERPVISQRLLRLTPLDEALSAALSLLWPVKPRRLAIADAIGAVLAAVVTAPSAVPSVATAARDGRAVRAEEVQGAALNSPVYLVSSPPFVDVGEPMPLGTDALLPNDTVIEVAGLVEATDTPIGVTAWERGYHAQEGAVIVPAGRPLTPIAAAASLAVGAMDAVIRRPRVRLLQVGEARPIDFITPLIARYIEFDGAEVIGLRHVEDDVSHIAASLGEAADLTITIGGTGDGSNDFTVIGGAQAGRILIHGIAISPGETTAIASIGTSLTILLPGSFEAAVAAYLLVVRPVLARLSARSEPYATRSALPIDRKIVSSIGMTELRFVSAADDGLTLIAGAGAPYGRLALADGFVRVSPNSEGLQAGTRCIWEPLPEVGS